MKSVYARWRERKTYVSYESMPNWLVIIYGSSCFAVSGYFGLVLSASMPKYLEVANTVHPNQWGMQGWGALALILFFSLVVWHHGSIALRCNTILRDRWYV